MACFEFPRVHNRLRRRRLSVEVLLVARDRFSFGSAIVIYPWSVSFSSPWCFGVVAVSPLTRAVGMRARVDCFVTSGSDAAYLEIPPVFAVAAGISSSAFVRVSYMRLHGVLVVARCCSR